MQGKKISTVKAVKHWKGDHRNVKSLSLDPLKTQLDEALSNLIRLHVLIYLHSGPYFGGGLDP